MWTVLLAAVAVAAPSLTVTGTCPGSITLSASGMTPGGAYSFISSDGFGAKVVSAGVCAGTPTTLSANGFKFRAPGVADGSGNVSVTFSPGAKACGSKMVILDETTCTVSPGRFLHQAGPNHLTVDFAPAAANGQWCDADAPVNYTYFGEMAFDDCEQIANSTGTQPYVGEWTDHLYGWIGDQDAANAAATDGGAWTNEAIVARTALKSCQLGQVEHRTEPTVSPIENLYTDGVGRVWHYWMVSSQTHSQAMSFADAKGARIVNPNSVGLTGLARMTAPTHWCHAGAQFNGASNCNSDNICDFVVGYWE